MPNWVYNTLEVNGNENELESFEEYVAANDKTVFCFKKIIPQPDDTSSLTEAGFPGWYIWGIRNWGTKWNCWDSELSKKKKILIYKFKTAWNAPYPIYEKIIDTYKQLNFKIDIWESVNYWTVEIATSGGEYTKYNFQDTDLVHWKKNLYIEFEYNEDVLNDHKLEIIQAAIYEKDEKITSSMNTSGSKNSNSESLSAGTSLDDLDDDDIIAQLEYI